MGFSIFGKARKKAAESDGPLVSATASQPFVDTDGKPMFAATGDDIWTVAGPSQILGYIQTDLSAAHGVDFGDSPSWTAVGCHVAVARPFPYTRPESELPDLTVGRRAIALTGKLVLE